MADATAAEMRENLKDISEAVALAAGVMGGATKMEFLRRTAATMEKLAIQTDLKASQESGQTHMSEDEVHQLLGPHADALIARAREIEAAEQREAERAEAIRDRAIAEQNREPVSYTHLDVYKRQDRYRRQGPCVQRPRTRRRAGSWLSLIHI